MSLFHNAMDLESGWRKRHGPPKNRRELFLCVLSDQLFSMIPINLTYMLFWLPAVVWTIAYGLQAAAFLENGAVTDAIGICNGWALGMIPCLAVTGPARAGMARLMRDWSREEYVPALRTFWRGVRENWKQALAISCMGACLPAILWYNIVTLLQSNGTTMSVILCGCLTVAAAVAFLADQVVYPLIVTYDLPLRGQLRNALLLTVLKLPELFLIRLGTLFFVGVYVLFVLARPELRYTLLIIPVLYYFSLGGSITELAFGVHAGRIFKRYFEN